MADTPPSHGPSGHGPNIETAFGSLLRIDVNATPQPPLAYAIPKNNPFVGREGLDEIYAYGLRNPYRFSFDVGDDENDDEDGAEGRVGLSDRDSAKGDSLRSSHPMERTDEKARATGRISR